MGIVRDEERQAEETGEGGEKEDDQRAPFAPLPQLADRRIGDAGAEAAQKADQRRYELHV